jgi:photosystem II stability/assembly factor-like uncharacterized protein
MVKTILSFKALLLTLFCTLAIINIDAQNLPLKKSGSYTPYLVSQPLHPDLPFTPVTIDEHTPEWAVLLYQKDVNFHTVMEKHDIWKRSNPEVKNGHTRNYKHYKKFLSEQDAIQADGSIKFKSDAELMAIASSKEEAYARQAKSSSRTNNAWTPIGPFATKDDGVYDDQQANIFSLAIDASNTNVIYVGTESGSVFKTTNEGSTWECVTEGLSIDGPMELEIQPNNTDVVYLGEKTGIRKTTNGGGTWTQVYTEASSDICSVIINPSNTSIVHACGDQGYYRSINGGSSWTKALSGIFYDLRFKADDPSVVMLLQVDATTKDVKLLRSVDGGLNFTTITSGWTLDNATEGRGGRMTTSENFPNIVYAFTGAFYNAASVAKNGVYIRKSTDGGLTWSVLYNYNTASSFRIDNGQGFYDWDIEMSDLDPNVVIVGSQDYVLTTDGFTSTSWTKTNPILGHSDIQEALFIGGNYWVANDGGLIKYNSDFSSYTVKSVGINATVVWGFDQGWNRDAQVITAYHNGTQARTDSYPSGEFLDFGGGEPRFAAMSNPNPNKVWSKGPGGGTNGKLMPESINQANNLGNFSWNIDPNGDYITAEKSEVEIHPHITNTHFTGSLNQLWKSTDFGTTWTSILTGGTGSRITKIEISKANANVMYVAEFNSSGYKLHKSTNGGLSFSVLPAIPTPTVGIYLSLDHTNENVVFIATRNSDTNDKVWKSTDGGMTWLSIDGSGGLPSESLQEIVAISGTNGGIYAMALNNIYYKNNTSEWQTCNNGLPASCTWRYMEPFYKENKIRAAGLDRGIYGANLEENPTTFVITPSVNKTQFDCVRDTAYFDDFSNVPHNVTSWAWTITPAPLYISNPNIRNPKVVFGTSGNYTASVVATVNGSPITKAIPNMITVNSICNVDQFATNAYETKVFADYAEADGFTEDSLTEFTVSFWVRPDSQTISNPTFFSLGATSNSFSIRQLDLTKRVVVDVKNTSGSSSTTLNINYNEWNHIAVSYSKAGSFTRLYVNGMEGSFSFTESTLPFTRLRLGYNIGSSTRFYAGVFEELAIYNRALTIDEIRLGMHLTKTSPNPSLTHYYQFNEPAGLISYDKIQNNHLTLKKQNILSRAPVGPGTSSLQNITNGGVKNFANEGLSLTFPNSGTYPNGNVVVTRLLTKPETLPTNNTAGQNYWAINNFGSNPTFSSITAASFNGYGSITEPEANSPIVFGLFKRKTGFDNNTWGLPVSLANQAIIDPSDTIKFAPTGLTSFSQMYIAKTSCVKDAMVDETTQIGTASLMSLVASICASDTIYFDPTLNGQMIKLTGSEINISKSIVIMGSGINNTIISGENLSRIFHLTNPLAIVCLENLTLTNGLDIEGSCILNDGNLCLKNVVLENNGKSSSALQNNGKCDVLMGTTSVKK